MKAHAVERLLAALDQTKSVFGAPGDYGYDTKEGAALHELYMATAIFKGYLKKEWGVQA